MAERRAMKYLILTISVLLAGCSQQVAQHPWAAFLPGKEVADTKYVKVLGRTWTVYPAVDQTGVYVAQRDNLDLDPYGAPAVRRSPQALRAIQLATGCRVHPSTMIQDTSARFFASVTCNR